MTRREHGSLARRIRAPPVRDEARASAVVARTDSASIHSDKRMHLEHKAVCALPCDIER
jgi:hypothetical protein